MGTWIEMGYGGCTNIILCVVVPLVGTWIEIQSQMLGRRSQRVVPLVGTWIEIFIPRHIYMINMSFPLWERGLKFIHYTLTFGTQNVVPLVGT